MRSAQTNELKICRIDRIFGSCKGGDEIFIFTEKVNKNNIKIRFFELDDEGHVMWQEYGLFSELDVHHQFAIAFKTPPYKPYETLMENRKVFLELMRPSDNLRSDPLQFTYVPLECNVYRPLKRPRMETVPTSTWDANEPCSSTSTYNGQSTNLLVYPTQSYGLQPEAMMTSTALNDDLGSINESTTEISSILKDLIESEDFAETLIELAADPDFYLLGEDNSNIAIDGITSQPPRISESPQSLLYEAVMLQNVEARQLLIDAGVKTNIGDMKSLSTPLHCAVQTQNFRMVQILLRSADPWEENYETSPKKTLLEKELACLSLDSESDAEDGADGNVKIKKEIPSDDEKTVKKRGQTAFDLAVNKPAILCILQKQVFPKDELTEEEEEVWEDACSDHPTIDL